MHESIHMHAAGAYWGPTMRQVAGKNSTKVSTCDAARKHTAQLQWQSECNPYTHPEHPVKVHRWSHSGSPAKKAPQHINALVRTRVAPACDEL